MITGQQMFSSSFLTRCLLRTVRTGTDCVPLQFGFACQALFRLTDPPAKHCKRLRYSRSVSATGVRMKHKPGSPGIITGSPPCLCSFVHLELLNAVLQCRQLLPDYSVFCFFVRCHCTNTKVSMIGEAALFLIRQHTAGLHDYHQEINVGDLT